MFSTLLVKLLGKRLRYLAAGRSQISFQRKGTRNTGRGVDRAQTIAGIARDWIGERVQWYDLSEEAQRG